MQHGARLEGRIGGQVHHKLHADGPVADMMARGKSKPGVELQPDRADGAIANHRQRGVNVHSRHETIAGPALLVHALIQQPDPLNLLAGNKRLGHRGAGPDLDRAGALHLRPNPLQELAHRKHQSAGLMQKSGRPRQLERLMPNRQQPAKSPETGVRRAQRPGSAADAEGIQQINHPLLRDRGGHGNLPRVELGQRRAQPPRPRHHSRHAKAEVIGPLVAQHLGRRAGQDAALDGRRAIGVEELPGKRGEKPRRGRPEADADNIRVHALAANRGSRLGKFAGHLEPLILCSRYCLSGGAGIFCLISKPARSNSRFCVSLARIRKSNPSLPQRARKWFIMRRAFSNESYRPCM